ncbi:MAG: DUF3106 domain-containing protein [Lysobacter sp.]
MKLNSRCRQCGVGMLALALAALAALAAPASAGPPDEVATLLPRLQPEARDQLQRRSARWTGWSGTERGAFQQRLRAWDGLPRAERDATRERYLAWQALPASERGDVAAAARQYLALPAEQQQALRERFEALDGSERRGWMLGPVLGGDYPALQPLLAQVPAEEHAPLLRTLRAMTPSQREDLAVLVQRSAPQDRAQLRSEMAAQHPSRLSDWLWERLDR